MPGVPDRLGDAAAHRGRRADHAVQPRVRDHLDDRRHPAALFPQQPRGGAAELDLGRRQRARAELVLEPLELHPRAALEHEAGEARGRLGQHEEDVARRIGAEPLVAVQLEPPVAGRLRPGRVGAHVRAALLLGHRHPAQRAGDQPRLPLGGQLRVDPQRGHGGVGHGDRAHHARVRVRPQQLQRRAGDVRARPRIGPRQRVDLARHRAVEQPVPGRVELDPVDPMAEPVVGDQPRLVALGAAAVRLRLGRAGDKARLAHPIDRPARAFTLQRLLQRRVETQQIDVLERNGLVEDFRTRLDGHRPIMSGRSSGSRGRS